MKPKTVPALPKVNFLSFSRVEEARPVLLVTSLPAWNAVKGKLHLNVAEQLEVTAATTEQWDEKLASQRIPHAEAVYAVGGGLTADAAKYMAVKLDLPLVVLPTALSVDAFFTPASGIRQEGCVHYIETKPPESLILDLEVVAAAPASLRAAGITDVLSIATGCWDWQFAHARGQNPAGMELIPWAYEKAQSILNAVLDCAEAAGRGDPDGLKQLLDCLCLEVKLCNQIGHARPEEGSEHYFAYCVEQFTGPGWPHGDLVGPGILLMAARQGQEVAPLRRALEVCQIPLERIPPETVHHTLRELPTYCRKHALPFGIAHVPQEGT
jgi:glycerol-1-phosphate dehydrogenase [NAD(P)+]